MLFLYRCTCFSKSTPWICQIRHVNASTIFCLQHICETGIQAICSLYLFGVTCCMCGLPVHIRARLSTRTYAGCKDECFPMAL